VLALDGLAPISDKSRRKEPLRRTGVELPPERDEGYYAEALNF